MKRKDPPKEVPLKVDSDADFFKSTDPNNRYIKVSRLRSDKTPRSLGSNIALTGGSSIVGGLIGNVLANRKIKKLGIDPDSVRAKKLKLKYTSIGGLGGMSIGLAGSTYLTRRTARKLADLDSTTLSTLNGASENPKGIKDSANKTLYNAYLRNGYSLSKPVVYFTNK